MNNAEMAAAKRMLAQLRLPVPPILSRRRQNLPGPLPDWRGTGIDVAVFSCCFTFRAFGGEL